MGCGMIRCMPEGMRCPRCDSRTSRLERVTDQTIDASCSTCGHRWRVSGRSLTSQTRQDIQLEILNRELKGFKSGPLFHRAIPERRRELASESPKRQFFRPYRS